MTDKTLEQVLAEQKADFDKAVEKLTIEGFWEKAKKAWGIPIDSSVDGNGGSGPLLS